MIINKIVLNISIYKLKNHLFLNLEIGYFEFLTILYFLIYRFLILLFSENTL